MWEFIASAPWTSGIVGGAIVIALAGVVYGILWKGGWEDKGFMLTEHGAKMKWKKSSMPIGVWVDLFVPDIWTQAIEDAVHKWNFAAGRNLFLAPIKIHQYMSKKMFQGHILVTLSDEESGFMQRDHGHTDLKFNPSTGEIYSAVITLPKESLAMAPYIAIHEFGHALGLEHDESDESIMYFELLKRRDPGKITDADAERIKRAYT